LLAYRLQPKRVRIPTGKPNNFGKFLYTRPKPNPLRTLIKGVICGMRVEEIQDPIMREIRYADKLIDELARGKAMEKILRRQ
jgi:hypothetical protein